MQVAETTYYNMELTWLVVHNCQKIIYFEMKYLQLRNYLEHVSIHNWLDKTSWIDNSIQG